MSAGLDIAAEADESEQQQQDDSQAVNKLDRQLQLDLSIRQAVDLHIFIFIHALPPPPPHKDWLLDLPSPSQEVHRRAAAVSRLYAPWARLSLARRRGQAKGSRRGTASSCADSATALYFY